MPKEGGGRKWGGKKKKGEKKRRTAVTLIFSDSAEVSTLGDFRPCGTRRWGLRTLASLIRDGKEEGGEGGRKQ